MGTYNDNDLNGMEPQIKQGYSVPANNFNREVSILWTKDGVKRKNTIDIFKAVEGKEAKEAIISEHLKLIAPNNFYMDVKHARPYSFLMEKLAQNINSNMARLGEDSTGLKITMTRAEWESRTQEKKKARSFRDLYNSLLEISNFKFFYVIYRENKPYEIVSGTLIRGDDIKITDDKTIEFLVPPKTVNLFIEEASQRGFLDAQFYGESDRDPLIKAFLSMIALEMTARRTNVLLLNIKDIVKKLSINDTDRRKERYVITPVKRMVEKAEKHGYRIKYLTQANTEPRGLDLMDYDKFIMLKLQIYRKHI